jgi:hypothetical protein
MSCQGLLRRPAVRRPAAVGPAICRGQTRTRGPPWWLWLPLGCADFGTPLPCAHLEECAGGPVGTALHLPWRHYYVIVLPIPPRIQGPAVPGTRVAGQGGQAGMKVGGEAWVARLPQGLRLRHPASGPRPCPSMVEVVSTGASAASCKVSGWTPSLMSTPLTGTGSAPHSIGGARHAQQPAANHSFQMPLQALRATSSADLAGVSPLSPRPPPGTARQHAKQLACIQPPRAGGQGGREASRGQHWAPP